MPGLRTGELMQEWMEADTPEMDIGADKVAECLLRDNEIMFDLIRELGAETELRRRLEAFQTKP